MFTAVILSAAIALTPPLSVNLGALKAGKLPAAGTIEEADSCALVMTVGYMSARAIAKGNEEQDKAAAALPMAWVARAAAFRSVASEDVYRDKSFEKALVSLHKIDGMTLFTLYRECGARLDGVKAP